MPYFTFYLLNESEAKLSEIKVLIDHPEIKVTKCPKEMVESSKDILEIKWSPSITLKKPLKVSFVIEDEALYEPK